MTIVYVLVLMINSSPFYVSVPLVFKSEAACHEKAKEAQMKELSLDNSDFGYVCEPAQVIE